MTFALRRVHPISESSEDEQESESIAATLSKARRERRAARFFLTVVPALFCILILPLTCAASILGVPFVMAIFPFVVLLGLVAILPTDKVAVKTFIQVAASYFLILASLCLLRGIRGMVNAVDGEECYYDEVHASLGKGKTVHCAWLGLHSTWRCLQGVVAFASAIWHVNLLWAVKDAGPRLDRFFLSKC